MSLVAKLTVKPLLITIGVLLLVIAVLSGSLVVQGSRLDVAAANVQASIAHQKSTATERDSWKLRAEELTLANVEWLATASTLQDELQRAQDQLTQVRKQTQAAVASARAAAADADRTLNLWLDRYRAQVGAPDCAKALMTLEAACPALQGY